MEHVEPSLIRIVLDGRGSRLYMPGETLAGSYAVSNIGGDAIQAIECSVLWYTTGKGSEDFGVHRFWRYDIERGDWIDPRRPGRFSTVLPNTPLSYPGIIVKIHWIVRVRVFLADGQDITEDLPFRLGRIHDVRLLS
ncbi:MAG: hypothetical protein LBT89_01320 [Planctomycetaceae bacterium]|jgi:hypothetical protein|nr:hypothetical protein [Planctomycetaceae bacterium]